MREGAADIGVLWDAADLGGLHAVPYRADHLCVAVDQAHPLAARKRMRFAETLAYPAVGVAPGGMMDALLRRQAALAGKSPITRVQVSSLDAACRIVGAGLGLAVLPREAAGPHAAALRLRLIPLADPWAVRRFVVCSRAEPMLSAVGRMMVEHLGRQR